MLDTITGSAPVARTALGALQGVMENGCAVFRGVPYAAAPVGGLRFAPPAPTSPWEGLRNATRNGPIAPQLPSRLERVMGGIADEQGEDCLYLTIWTPAPDAAKRPVLVWYHGGGFISGAGSLAWYDGGAMAAAGGIVVVGVNYRLGALGYLYQEGLIEESLALLDQQAALRWVIAHIGAFGGDPGQITIGGQSAGASSATMLLDDIDLGPCVRRAILQSGAFGFDPRTPAQGTATAVEFMQRLGIDPVAPDRLSHLRSVAVADILAAQHNMMAANPNAGLVFRPIARHGETTPADSIARFAAACAGKDVLIGFTADEGYSYTGGLSIPLDQAIGSITAQLGEAGARQFIARFPGADGASLLAELRSATSFTDGTVALATAIARAGGRSFGYVFEWHPPASPFKAGHCVDLPFSFGNRGKWGDCPMLEGGAESEMVAVSAMMQAAWISFIRNGVPDLGPDRPAWPMVTAEEAVFQALGRRIGVRPASMLVP